jgi:hypothetical protein
MIFRSSSASAQSAHAPQTRNGPESAPARFNPRPGRMLDRRARIEARLRRTLIVAPRFALDNTIRNSHRARRRGWITASTTAAELSVTANASRTFTFRWRTSEDDEREKRTFEIGWDDGAGDKLAQGKLIEHDASPESSNKD